MNALTSALRRLLIVVAIILIGWLVTVNYSFFFSDKVAGEVIGVERITQPAIVGGSQLTTEQMFSFAVMIRSFDGKMYTASSEDRQWAVVKKGYCVEARFYPYPPWNLDKAGTYFNARLVRPFECKSEAPPGWMPSEH